MHPLTYDYVYQSQCQRSIGTWSDRYPLVSLGCSSGEKRADSYNFGAFFPGIPETVVFPLSGVQCIGSPVYTQAWIILIHKITLQPTCAVADIIGTSLSGTA